MIIKLQSYLDYLQLRNQSSPVTLQNYDNYIKMTAMTEVDSENLNSTWRLLLSKLESGVSYGAIQGVLKVIRSSLKLHGMNWTRDYDYNILVAKLSKCGTVPIAYNEQQVSQILKVTQSADYDLFRLCALCTYSGLRVNAGLGLKFADFRKVDHYGIFVYTVTSKTITYTAALSAYAFKLLELSNFEKQDLVVKYDSSYKSDFAKYYREKLKYVLRKKGLAEILQKRKPFHSMRKFYSQQLAGCGLDKDDIALLMGHIPKSTAWKTYILEGKKIIPESLDERVAIAYNMTPLNKVRLI